MTISNIRYILNTLLPFLCILLLASCSPGEEPQETNTRSVLSHDISAGDIQTHIAFLADDALRGREAGTAGEARAANYIADLFRDFGLHPAGDSGTYVQEFIINMALIRNPHASDDSSSVGEKRIARNVIGLIRGTEQPDRYLVIGAHYDHIGMGAFGSLNNGRRAAIHNGADDNASGTAGLLELAHYFSRVPPKTSLLFIAFSGEEMGLLGSRHFVEHPTIPLEQITAMINMDMIGRMQNNKLIILGTGSSSGWEPLIKEINSDSLYIHTVPDGTGASDHTSFYNKKIPVLHYFTDTHADYHRPSDDPEYINYKGQSNILRHIQRLVTAIDTARQDLLAYTEAPETEQQNMTLKGVTLGVTPDYGFDGKGMRITGVRNGGPADEAGLQSGDIIIGLNGHGLADIYDYMEALNTLEEGEKSTVTVLRDDEKLTFDLAL